MQVQENHYDPWGLNLVGIESQGSPDHKFQYNGKEKQEEFGLHWNDFDARQHDPQLGRFLSLDPHVENYFDASPYGFVLNNPIKYSDPTGMDTITTNNQPDNQGDEILNDDGTYSEATVEEVKFGGTTVANTRYMLDDHPILHFFMGWYIMNQAKTLDTRDSEGSQAYLYAQINIAHREIGLEFSTGGYTNPSARAPRRLIFAKNVSPQKMARHLAGTAPSNKSYFTSINDAQAVLDAYNSGNYRLISENIGQSTVTIEVQGVQGRYVNIGNPNGLINLNLPTNRFMIQSTSSPKVVPVNPNK